jgi:hypothetical protein
MRWKDIKNIIDKELKEAKIPADLKNIPKELDKASKMHAKQSKALAKSSKSHKSQAKRLRKAGIKEATVSAGDSKFNLRTGVNKNPTKLGIKIQFEPKGEFLAPDVKNKLEVALQEKLNAALLQYNIQVSKDTDVPRKHVIGFFIPISQLKNLIVKALGGVDVGAEEEEPKVAAPEPSKPGPTSTDDVAAPLTPEEETMAEMITQELLNEALRVRDLNEISRIVYKEDFYGFINAGQNVMRTLEDAGFESKMAKKYLEHLVKNNII